MPPDSQRNDRPEQEPEQMPVRSVPEGEPAQRRRHPMVSVGRGILWCVVGVVLLVAVLVGGFAWYSTTADFQRRVGNEVVSLLEDATGGRVELHGLNFRLWHLAVEADGLVIHGLEGPGEAPYLSADKILVRVKISNFLSRATGKGIASHVGLNLLRVEHPQFHLMIDKDGHTNQPTPKHPSKSSEPIQDTLLDLKADEMALVDGVALINDQAMPLNLAARDVSAEVHYLAAGDRYGIVVDLKDLRTKMAKLPEAQSKLHLEGELGRDVAEVKSFELDSGTASVLHGKGTLTHFAKPEWNADVNGSLDLKQVGVLTGQSFLTGGTADLALSAHSCQATAPVPAEKPRLWQRLKQKGGAPVAAPAVAKSAEADCSKGFLATGDVKVRKAGYRDEFIRLHDVDGGGKIRITPDEMLLTELKAHLPGGGYAAGDLRLAQWLGKAGESRGYLDATVNAIPLRTILDVTAEHYGDLGFDTSVTGPVKAEWGGPAKDVADTVVVNGSLKFKPTGVTRRGALNNIPVTGEGVAKYDGRRQVVTIDHITLLTPQSTIEANGVLGVNGGDRLTNLKTDLTVKDLGEYDQLLQTLGLEANGKKGTAAIPVVLHGGLVFHGTASGPSSDLDVKGHLEGTELEVKLGTELDTMIDSLVADAEFSNNEGLLVASSTIKRGTATLNVSGSMKPREELASESLHAGASRKAVSRKGAPTFVWDEGSAVDAKVVLADASVTDVLDMAGQKNKVPVTGTIAVHAEATGTLSDLNGQGTIALTKGVAYGEPYDSATMNLAVHGQSFEASQVALSLHGMKIGGSGGYDLTTKHLHGHIAGDTLQLAKFVTLQKALPGVDGMLTLTADADGTMEQPGAKVALKLAKISVKGSVIGDVSGELHSEGSAVLYSLTSDAAGAKTDLSGRTELTGDYTTQAKLTLANLDAGKLLDLFGSSAGINAQSSLSGTVTVSGPLKTPMLLTGAAELDNLDVTVQGVELKSAGAVRVGLHNGLATLDQVHIMGPETDLQASGTAQVFGSTSPTGGKLDMHVNGGVNMAIAKTFDPDITSSGKMEFQIAAGGGMKKPQLTGKVQFDNVNAAMAGVPNGLSNLNGTLVFNEDRLQVESLTATTGGGLMKLGGFLTYNNGLYANLTATGDTVRVRLYGLSSTVRSSLKLEGGMQNLRLSGDILITRFGVGPDVDFAAFTSASGGMSMPSDPNAPANKIHLDVHITSSPQLDFQNSYAKLAGNVDLHVGGTVANPAILGRIQITDGSATFAGTKYELQRGDIYFANPVRIDPTIDLDATARVETYDLTVGLHGTASNLKPTYRSEPPLSESDIFALLALGRTQEEAQLYQEQQVQQGTDPTTSALLGGALNATVSSRVNKIFGGGSVKIDPAFVGTLGNSSARITVQQQLSRQLSVTFATNVNSTAQQLLQGQYDLTPNASLVVTRDETGVFSVVYKIRRRYK